MLSSYSILTICFATDTVFEEGQHSHYLRHDEQPEGAPSITGSPQLHPFWSAGFSFSRGHFVVNVPYDFYQPLIFQGEEMSIGVRGFTIGYDFYVSALQCVTLCTMFIIHLSQLSSLFPLATQAPEKDVCFHHYDRKDVPKFFAHNRVFAGAGIRSMTRMLAIVHMNPGIDPSMWDHTDEEKYGIGGVESRSPEHFYEIFGIDVKNKSTEGHLCSFVVTGDMHKMFTPFLRADGMGIDYSKIDYKFTDPRPDETDNEDTEYNDDGTEE